MEFTKKKLIKLIKEEVYSEYKGWFGGSKDEESASTEPKRDLSGIPRSFAYKLFTSNKSPIYSDILRALNLEQGGKNDLILGKIKNQMQRCLENKSEPGVFNVPQICEGLSEIEMRRIITFIDEFHAIEIDNKRKMNELINKFI